MAARRVKDSLESHFSGNKSIVDVSIVPGKTDIGGRKANAVQVDVQQESAPDVSVPDYQEGVSVRTKSVKRDDNEVSLQFCNNMGDYDGVVGGVESRAIQDGDNTLDETGTICCPVKKDSTEYALVANHMFLPNDSECDGNWDKRLFQDDADDYIGKVKRYNESMDYALVKPYDSSVSMQQRVESESWSDGEIISHVTKTGLQDYMATETTVYKMGVSTGKGSGTIRKIDASFTKGCPNIDGEGVRTEASSAAGDSGGPHYLPTNSDGISIIGSHVGTKQLLSEGTTCTGTENELKTYATSIASPAYKMANQDSIQFGY